MEREIDDAERMRMKASAKRLFEALMDETPDRIYIKDRHSRFIAASTVLARLHGFQHRDELDGLTDFDLFSHEHAQQAFDDEQEIIRTGEPMINKIEKETWPDGSITWVSSTKSPLHLDTSGKLVGIIGISRDVTAEKHAREKLAANEARLREQNKIMRADYESAAKVQSVMIPGRLPDPTNLSIAYLWKPMTAVGGDLLTFPRNPGNCPLFFLGDVCGHGVSAAFYTVLLKYLTSHTAEAYDNDPQAFLNTVHREVQGRIREGFVTGLAGHFGQRSPNGGRSLILSNSGHRHVLIYRKTSQEVELHELPSATVMGLPGSQASEPIALELEPGDRFYAFTDGIFEASNQKGEEFGMEYVIRSFHNLSEKPLQETLDKVYESAQEFTSTPHQQDDITLLGFEII